MRENIEDILIEKDKDVELIVFLYHTDILEGAPRKETIAKYDLLLEKAYDYWAKRMEAK